MPDGIFIFPMARGADTRRPGISPDFGRRIHRGHATLAAVFAAERQCHVLGFLATRASRSHTPRVVADRKRLVTGAAKVPHPGALACIAESRGSPVGRGGLGTRAKVGSSCQPGALMSRRKAVMRGCRSSRPPSLNSSRPSLVNPSGTSITRPGRWPTRASRVGLEIAPGQSRMRTLGHGHGRPCSARCCHGQGVTSRRQAKPDEENAHADRAQCPRRLGPADRSFIASEYAPHNPHSSPTLRSTGS